MVVDGQSRMSGDVGRPVRPQGDCGRISGARSGPGQFPGRGLRPCEASACAYTINGVQVSDFFTPHFFDPVQSAGVRYSYTGALTAPRQVLKDGYLSWYVPASKRWWQRTWFGSQPSDKALGNLNLSGTNIRAAIDRLTEEQRAKAVDKASPSSKHMAKAIQTRAGGRDAFAMRAGDLREVIRNVSAKARHSPRAK